MCYARRQRSSWARIKLSKSWYQNDRGSPPSIQSCFRVLLLASFTFVWVVFSLEFPRSVSSCSLCTSLLLFNFQRSSAARFRAATLIFYHFPQGLSSTFLKFFQLFWSFFKVFSKKSQKAVKHEAVFDTAFLLYPTSSDLSSPFLFFVFFITRYHEGAIRKLPPLPYL